MTAARGRRSERSLAFTATPHAVGRHQFWAPDGDYSRRHWLPMLGPTSWLLWGTLTHRLEGSDESIGVGVDTLTVELGLGRPQRLLKALSRLEHFGLAQRTDDDNWTILTVAPTAPASASTPRITRPNIDRDRESGAGVDGCVVDSLRIVTPPAGHLARAFGS